jgi:uncharacterized membrane protein YidH (DUF202 family)
MPDNGEDALHPRVRNRRVHMANERTFLAWIRTSIGIMAFGFVVEKFAIFVRRVSLFLREAGSTGGQGMAGAAPPHPPSHEYSSLFGICFIVLGALMGVLALVRYKKVEKQIDTDTYRPSLILDIMLVLAIIVIGIFLSVYLLRSI